MTLSPKIKTAVLSVTAQLPILLLFFIFFRVDNMAPVYRVLAAITIFIEAVLLSELVGNIVQKVRTNKKGIVVRGVLERTLIPWDHVRGVRQIILSPMKKGTKEYPVKLFIIKGKNLKNLMPAQAWWMKYGPLRNKRTSMSDLVEKYEKWVSKELHEWYILWEIEYWKPQKPYDDVQVKYIAFEEREKQVCKELAKHSKKLLEVLYDYTYPTFIKKKGGRYAEDVEHIWRTIDE